jgi:hypothetical protein
MGVPTSIAVAATNALTGFLRMNMIRAPACFVPSDTAVLRALLL